MNIKVDILGGGVSGILSADFLSRKCEDVDISIHENKSFRDYSVNCAEGFINSRGWLGKLNEISVSIKPYIRNDIDESRQIFYRRGDVTENVVPTRNFYIVDRESWQKDFLRKLNENSNIEVNMASSSFDIDGDVIVDATGSSESDYLAKAVYGVYRGNFNDNQALLEFREGEDGYYWIFPHSEGVANIGYFGVSDVNMKKVREYVENKDVREEVEAGAGLLDFSLSADMHGLTEKKLLKEHKNKPMVKVGDAAGLVDPLTGEGLSGAVSSSYILAECLSDNRLESYEERVRKENLVLKKSMNLFRKRKENFDKFIEEVDILNQFRASSFKNKLLLLLKNPLKATKLIFK
ncbi:hypothetical protein C9439_05400 [archaeon SCG-AAA382B04]|nr:hypothetical protein C9439_05400 [archaeon SCG-AAA382B04]